MIIQEFLPNPAGKDSDGEYILLFNDAKNIQSLDGWSIRDAGGKVFKLSGQLTPNKELRLVAGLTKINLNNSGETVTLYNASGKVIDSLSYTGTAGEDIPVARVLTGETQAKLFDDLPGRFMPVQMNAGGSVWIVFLISTCILAILSVWIMKNITEEKYNLYENEN